MANIDRLGNITLSRSGDLFVPICRKDASGNIVDLSTAVLKFQVEGGFTIVPDVDPNVSTGRIIHFTATHALSLLKPAAFALQLSLSDGTHQILWSGTIKSSGFVVL